MSDPLVQVVDENDVLQGSTSVSEVQEKGLYHRIARVMVEDPRGNILLQKRANIKGSLYPGRWDNSAAGHVDEGEDYETAARRELMEEIGLKDVKLEETYYYKANSQFEWRKLNRFTRVYKVVVPRDTKFTLQPDEVSEVRWFTPKELNKLVENEPNNITDGVADVYKRMYR